MKIFRVLLAFIASLSLVFFIITLFLPSNYEVQREIEISAPKTLVYYLIDDLRNWKFWDYWFSLDTNQIRKYDGPLFGKNSSFRWESKIHNVGTGSLKIIENEYFNKIRTEITFGRNMVANSDFIIDEIPNGTKVRWKFYGSLSFIAKWFRFFLDKTAGEDLRLGLSNLKELAEKIVAEKVKYFLDEIPTIKYIGVVDSSSMNPMEISQKFSLAFQEIDQFITNKRLKHTSSAIAISLSYNQSSYKFIACLPVEDFYNATPEGRIILDSIPASKVVRSVYIGPYENFQAIYSKIYEFMTSKQIKPKSYSFELYITDPTMVKPHENVTVIYFVI